MKTRKQLKAIKLLNKIKKDKKKQKVSLPEMAKVPFDYKTLKQFEEFEKHLNGLF